MYYYTNLYPCTPEHWLNLKCLPSRIPVDSMTAFVIYLALSALLHISAAQRGCPVEGCDVKNYKCVGIKAADACLRCIQLFYNMISIQRNIKWKILSDLSPIFLDELIHIRHMNN